MLFYYLMLEFYMVNVTDATALYIFFGCLFVAAGALALTVHWGNQERAEEEARLAAEKAAYVCIGDCVRGCCVVTLPLTCGPE